MHMNDSTSSADYITSMPAESCSEILGVYTISSGELIYGNFDSSAELASLLDRSGGVC